MLNLGIRKGEHNKMNEITSQEEKEPIYFTPKRVNMISDFASILSWVVLVGFLGDVIMQLVSLVAQIKSQSLVLATLLKQPSFFSYIFVNLLVPLLTGLALFAILQAAAVGLNMLLEMDFNAREKKN
jgi:hypothetical protein